MTVRKVAPCIYIVKGDINLMRAICKKITALCLAAILVVTISGCKGSGTKNRKYIFESQ